MDHKYIQHIITGEQRESKREKFLVYDFYQRKRILPKKKRKKEVFIAMIFAQNINNNLLSIDVISRSMKFNSSLNKWTLTFIVPGFIAKVLILPHRLLYNIIPSPDSIDRYWILSRITDELTQQRFMYFSHKYHQLNGVDLSWRVQTEKQEQKKNVLNLLYRPNTRTIKRPKWINHICIL